MPARKKRPATDMAAGEAPPPEAGAAPHAEDAPPVEAPVDTPLPVEAPPPKKKKRTKKEEAAPQEGAPPQEQAAPKKKKKKRATSAYQLFQKSKSEEAKANGVPLPFNECSKQCSVVWKSMTDEAKKPWVDQAKALREAANGPPKPKAPLTPFFKFLAVFRKTQTYLPRQMAVEAGIAWRALTPEQRAEWNA